jgi:hypothetical protein
MLQKWIWGGRDVSDPIIEVEGCTRPTGCRSVRPAWAPPAGLVRRRVREVPAVAA